MARSKSVWVIAIAVLLAGLQPARSQDENVVTIATAGHGGVYLPTGNAICQFVNAERAYAIVQSDVQAAALRGSRQF